MATWLVRYRWRPGTHPSITRGMDGPTETIGTVEADHKREAILKAALRYPVPDRGLVYDVVSTLSAAVQAEDDAIAEETRVRKKRWQQYEYEPRWDDGPWAPDGVCTEHRRSLAILELERETARRAPAPEPEAPRREHRPAVGRASLPGLAHLLDNVIE